MNCPRCQELIVAEDVNLNRLLAKCKKCHEVFRFTPSDCATHLQNLDGWPITKAPRPERIEVEEFGDERRIVREWFTDGWFLTALFGFTWTVGWLIWLGYAIITDADFWAVLCPLPCLGFGALSVYGNMAYLLNRSVIELKAEFLEVRHGPVPIPRSAAIKIPTSAIEQFYCTYAKVYSDDRERLVGASVNLNAILKDGRQKILLWDFPLEEGLFIEQQLEEWLKIAPARVPGQVD